jgi:predicted nucleic acid-binding protein
LSVFVDTSVWSLALRRDAPSSSAQVAALIGMLENGDPILTTGFVLQELLQGFTRPKAREQIIERFSALPLLVPQRQDHINAAE